MQREAVPNHASTCQNNRGTRGKSIGQGVRDWIVSYGCCLRNPSKFLFFFSPITLTIKSLKNSWLFSKIVHFSDFIIVLIITNINRRKKYQKLDVSFIFSASIRKFKKRRTTFADIMTEDAITVLEDEIGNRESHGRSHTVICLTNALVNDHDIFIFLYMNPRNYWLAWTLSTWN